jgi:hypothetical protein
MDINKFIPSNDQSILERLEKEGQPVAVGSFEDFLKLELPDCYKQRIEKEKSKDKVEVEDGSRPTTNN